MSKQARPTSSPPQGKTQAKDAKKSGVDSGKMAPRISNKRAYFDYEILDKIEAGIELVGSEVKSVRKGHVQLAQSFARIRGNEVILHGTHIDEYTEANQLNHDPTRNPAKKVSDV